MDSRYDWNDEKNQQLISQRNIAFEEIIFAVDNGGLLDDVAHPNRERYPHQRMLVVKIDNYAYLVPYVVDEEILFLKTIVPSRKATKQYLGKR